MKFEQKVRLVSLFILIGFCFIVFKLCLIQVFSAEKFSAQADAQHFYSLNIPARRGEIRANDNYALAADKNDYLFYVNLSKFTDSKDIASEKIAEILAADIPYISTDSAEVLPKVKEDFYKAAKDRIQKSLWEKLNVKNAVWVNLAHFVTAEQKVKIEALKISGLGFLDEQSRDYPESSMAAHLLGFVGFDSVGDPKGYFGLEGFYERELAGKEGELRIEKDALGRPIAIGSETRRDKLDGRDLITTIDRSVQRFTQNHLSQGIKEWKATGGTAIVMDPKTGAILAMANYPQYDPRNYSYYKSELYKNPAVANLYEPGSIMKPLVVAAAINENKLSPETRCPVCSGPRKIGENFIHTFNDQYSPNLTMTEVLVNSDNTGMVFVGESLGFEKLISYVNSFGFGQKSGVDLQEEEEGTLRNPKNYYEMDRATLTFGQGISVNAMQMMKAWSALANNGKTVTPHLVSKINDRSKPIELNWPQSSQILSPSTTRAVTEMLVRVARESPIHFPLERVPQLKNFRIAAKSGTAQISTAGRYSETGYTASVIGYFPADDPKFLLMVKLNEPEVRIWGSDTAGPIFAAIARDLLYYYGISP